jgi:transposase InsO family protein
LGVVGEKRVARLMALAGAQGAHQRHRRKGCSIGVEGVEPFRDLVGRNFRPGGPNVVWGADIKQIRTGEGWLYLAAVQDLFSRRIVGWSGPPCGNRETSLRRAGLAQTNVPAGTPEPTSPPTRQRNGTDTPGSCRQRAQLAG